MTDTKDDEVGDGSEAPGLQKKSSSGNEISSFVASKEWQGTFPGPADRSFNYRKLLDESPKGIGDAKKTDLKVAIIGAGPAGLTAAHELVRSGVKAVHLFEASDRYGGRFWTKTVDADNGEAQLSAMDAGAMRMPPFIKHDEISQPRRTKARQEQIWAGKSVLSYYLSKFQISTDEFPNPGSPWADTGIYYNEGSLKPAYDEKEVKAQSDGKEMKDGAEYGKDLDKNEEAVDLKHYTVRNSDADGQMLIWPKGMTNPPNEQLREVKRKWDEFGAKFKELVAKNYSTNNWQELWQSIVRSYYDKTFRDVVFLEPDNSETMNKKGYFGGMGMSEEEARIFYVIGAGDGGWGSFFNLSFLYVYRTFVHGFGTDLQVIEGLFDEEGKRRLGRYQDFYCHDSLGSQIRSPEYLGTSTLTDCLLFHPYAMAQTGKSLYDSQEGDPNKIDGFKMFFSSPVEEIEKKGKKVKIHVKSPGDQDIGYGVAPLNNYDFSSVEYDAVIITVPTHQFGTEIKVTGFDPVKEWPYNLQAYLSQAHWEPCCKVFVELTEPYWENDDCNIPQIIESETAIRDTYGVKVDRGTEGRQNGILLLSYTWWRDATKLVGYDDQELINLAVKEADRMLANCRNLKPDDRISEFAKFTKDEFGNKNYKGWVHRWELQKHFKGAARLYDQRTWNNTQVPMMYNQLSSEHSNLYFAGEGYHVDAGWAEPAFRTAIDAVLRLFKNKGVDTITDGFVFDRDFAEYDPNFKPMESN